MFNSTPFFPFLRPFLGPLGRRSGSCLRRLRQATLSQIEERFSQVLPASLFPIPFSGPNSRLRVYSLHRTVWCWLWQVLQGSASCREVVRQVQALFSLCDAGSVDEGSSAYCQARGRLPLVLLESLFRASSRCTEHAAPAVAKPLLQNRPVRVADCSGARLCDTPSNRAQYPPSSNMLEGAGFPFLRFVVLFSLASGALLAQASGSMHQGELRLWYSLLSALRPGDILLGDRAYGCYVVAALLQSVGCDLVATIPTRLRKVDFRKAAKRLGPHDARFIWKKPAKPSAFLDAHQWRALPAQITVRILRISLERKGFRSKHMTVVTTLLEATLYPKIEIAATYARRWRLEMTLDDLKTTLGMEHLTCQSPQMLKKELLVFLTAHNLVRWLMAQAASHGRIDLEGVSFKGSLDAFRQWSHALAQRHQRHRRNKLWLKLLNVLVADALPIRPGRHEPRAVKKRSKYPHLNQPRAQYTGRPSRKERRRISKAKNMASS